MVWLDINILMTLQTLLTCLFIFIKTYTLKSMTSSLFQFAHSLSCHFCTLVACDTINSYWTSPSFVTGAHEVISMYYIEVNACLNRQPGFKHTRSAAEILYVLYEIIIILPRSTPMMTMEQPFFSSPILWTFPQRTKKIN